jgi:hypothetical protein
LQILCPMCRHPGRTCACNGVHWKLRRASWGQVKSVKQRAFPGSFKTHAAYGKTRWFLTNSGWVGRGEWPTHICNGQGGSEKKNAQPEIQLSHKHFRLILACLTTIELTPPPLALFILLSPATVMSNLYYPNTSRW